MSKGHAVAKIELLTVDEVAVELRLSPSSVRRLLREKTLHRVEMGPRRYLVSREQLDEFIRRSYTTGD